MLNRLFNAFRRFTRRPQRHTPLAGEQLESRRNMSVEVVGGNLLVIADAEDNVIQISPVGNSGNIRVRLDETNTIVSGVTGYVEVRAGAGDDIVQVTKLTQPAILYGEDGHDFLAGAAGDDRLYGGYGDDTLRGYGGHDLLAGNNGDDLAMGGAGNDVLLGGLGADVLLGEAGNDLLLGGLTYYSTSPYFHSPDDSLAAGDEHDQAMAAFLVDWSSDGQLLSLFGIVLGISSISDGEIDILIGGDGIDTARAGTEDNGSWEFLI